MTHLLVHKLPTSVKTAGKGLKYKLYVEIPGHILKYLYIICMQHVTLIYICVMDITNVFIGKLKEVHHRWELAILKRLVSVFKIYTLL